MRLQGEICLRERLTIYPKTCMMEENVVIPLVGIRFAILYGNQVC